MARKKSDPGEEPVKKATRSGARQSTKGTSASRPKLARVQRRWLRPDDPVPFQAAEGPGYSRCQ